MTKTRAVVINLEDADCRWLERHYGAEWVHRVEQHIHSEIHIRKVRDKDYHVQKENRLGD